MHEKGLIAKRLLLVFTVCLVCFAMIVFTKTEAPKPTTFLFNTTKNALVSLLTIDGPQSWWSQKKYINSARKLAISFRKHSSLDMVLIVMDEYGAFRNADEKRLRDSGWMVHRLRNGVVPKLFGKLWMWRMTMYEQILYADLDTLFIQSPSQLFRMRLSSQNPAMALDTVRHHYFSTGVIVLRPSEDEYQRLVTHTSEAAEQDLLNNYFNGRIVQLDARFNSQVCNTKGCMNDQTLHSFQNRTVILHFTGNNKPWNIQNCVTQNIVQLCLYWKRFH